MGFLSSLFGHKSKDEYETEKIFRKIDKVLNDDRVQNQYMPKKLKEIIDMTSLDSLPDAMGQFGRDPRNPILCNGPLGEVTYLSKLVIPTTEKNFVKVTFHRTKSLKVNNQLVVDQYEIISYDGIFYDVLYLDMYHANKSKSCPKGYQMEKQCIGFRGTDDTNPNFPCNQYEYARNCAEKMIGTSIFDTQLKNLDMDRAKGIVNLCRKLGPGSVNWWNPPEK